MLGNLVKNVKGGSDTINKMKDIGCELGSHTYDHTQLTKLGTDALKKQVQDTNDNINEHCRSRRNCSSSAVRLI